MNTNLQSSQPRSTLVLGLGKTGYSVIAHLAARGEKITVADSREQAPYFDKVRENFPQVTIIRGRLPVDDFTQFDRVVISPGIAMEGMQESAAVEHQPLGNSASSTSSHASSRHVIGDIELFVQEATAPIIAITGSNGKSTVTMLVSNMLAAAGKKVLVGGNIGTPALELLTQETPDFYVVEVSSFQLENTHSLAAAAATVLNISEDHMDRYRDIAQYAEAKSRVLENAKACVLNRDDPASQALLTANPNAICFGLNRPSKEVDYGVMTTEQGKFMCRGETALAEVDQLAMHGEQNVANALAAFALVEAVGVSITKKVCDALLAYRGLEHRCELAAEINGVKWINDSKGTNVGATVAAINGCGGGCGDGDCDLILIAGGLGKGADFSPLKKPVREHVCQAVLFGQDAERIAEAIATETKVSRADDLKHAMSLAARCAQAGQSVLFSPACASFDMFENYEQRGLAFKELLAQQHSDIQQSPRCHN